MDNYATHNTVVIKTWLTRRPHYHDHVYFTPTTRCSDVYIGHPLQIDRFRQ